MGKLSFGRALMDFLTTGITVAIIVIIAEKLYPSYDFSWLGLTSNETVCLLGFNDSISSNLCGYMWGVCAASLVAVMLLYLLLCCTCKCCGCGGIIEAIVYACLAVWWGIAGIIIAIGGANAQDVNFPEQPSRIAVIVITWINVVFFLISMVFALANQCKCLACLLCCGGGDKDEHKKSKHDAEAPPPVQTTAPVIQA